MHLKTQDFDWPYLGHVTHPPTLIQGLYLGAWDTVISHS